MLVFGTRIVTRDLSQAQAVGFGSVPTPGTIWTAGVVGWVHLQFHTQPTRVPDTPLQLFLLPGCIFPSLCLEDNMLHLEHAKRNLKKKPIKIDRKNA